jgi:hypothetical protein
MRSDGEVDMMYRGLAYGHKEIVPADDHRKDGSSCESCRQHSILVG